MDQFLLILLLVCGISIAAIALYLHLKGKKVVDRKVTEDNVIEKMDQILRYNNVNRP